MSEHSFELFADYHQFYLQDEKVDGNLSDSWTPEATERLLAIAPGTIGVGTVRNMDVPVQIKVLTEAPDLDLDAWDHVVECGIDVPTGKIVVAGCTDYFPDAARIIVPVGHYRARVLYSGLDAISEDGLDGKDRYHVVLWPADGDDVTVLKFRRAG